MSGWHSQTLAFAIFLAVFAYGCLTVNIGDESDSTIQQPTTIPSPSQRLAPTVRPTATPTPVPESIVWRERLGCGVSTIIDSGQEYLVTAYHCMENRPLMQSQWGPISAAHDIALKSVASPNEKAFPLGSLSWAVEGAYAIGPNGRVPVTLMERRYGPTKFNLNCNIATCWDAHAANWPGFSGSPIFDQFDNFIGLLVGGYEEIDGVAIVVAGIDVREVISYAQPWFEQDFRQILDIQDPSGIRYVSLKGMNFLVEIAATPAERGSGLAHREALASNAGMLFVFSWEYILTFWMKGVLIPLDILYMDAAGVIVDIHTMVPEPGVADSELRTYVSTAPAQYALVINAGLAESHGFSVGDEASFR